MNTGVLLNRMNFALGLTEGRFPGTRPDLGRCVAGADQRDPKALLDRLLAGLLHNQVTPTRGTFS